MKQCKLFVLLLTLALCICMAAAADEPVKYTSGDFVYILLEDGTAEITAYTGKAVELDVPETLDGYRVTGIGDGAFRRRISLMSITIPDSVTNLGVNPFQECSALTTIRVRPSHPVLATIDGVLFNKTTKTLICYPADLTGTCYSVPAGILCIGDYAFSSCTSLASITIPDSVSDIGNAAFFHCLSLTTMTIPNGVTNIGNNAFASCSSLTSITIPDSVTNVGYGAFVYCTSLTDITIPEGVASIGSSTFDSCRSLMNVTIPGSVTNIGVGVFAGCSDNLLLTVPQGSYAEQWCIDNNLYYTYPNANDWLLN